MQSLFLQFHTLTSYPGALLNRDDLGFAKRLPFGGAVRTRVSSQCLKRHWRSFAGKNGWRDLGEPMSVRSRLTFQRCIHDPLVAEGVPDDVVDAVTRALMKLVLGESPKAAVKSDGAVDLKTGQVTVIGRPEVDYLLGEARAICQEAAGNAKAVAAAVKARMTKAARNNLKALRLATGLDAALFGRMVTGDILARGDAALHVAHAFTVHEQATESDYFSAVDDLQRPDDEEQQGSGHIGSAELTSGLFYGYTVVDVPLLVSNLEGCEPEAWRDADRSLASRVVERFVHLAATVSPGAKLGSTAPHAYAQLILTEAGSAQPRTLANAFLRPVRERPDLLENAYVALGRHLADLDRMYGGPEERLCAALGPRDALEGVAASTDAAVSDVAAWAAERVRSD